MGMARILDALADDRDVIAYRPRLRTITLSATGAILFQQIIFRAKNNRWKPFYKFAAPCEHGDYKEGDSWQEELGFTEREFEGARDCIALKISIGVKKNDLLDDALVFYWTDANRRTWYEVNQVLVESLLDELYSGANGHIVLYQEKRKAYLTKKRSKRALYNRTKTSKTTQRGSAEKPSAPSTDESLSHKQPVISEKGETNPDSILGLVGDCYATDKRSAADNAPHIRCLDGHICSGGDAVAPVWDSTCGYTTDEYIDVSATTTSIASAPAAVEEQGGDDFGDIENAPPPERTKRTRAKQGKPKATKEPKLSDHPAIQVFRDVRSSYPCKESYQPIIDAVGDSPDSLEQWRKVLVWYAMKGWNPRNVDGALDVFKKGIPTNGNGKKQESKLAQWDRVFAKAEAIINGEQRTDPEGFEKTIDGVCVAVS